ncbi:MAG: PilZ domain-containing protein [Nitrospirota bacterium]
MVERRRNLRVAVTVMNMKGRTVFTSRVQILNLSVGGIALKISRRLMKGKQYVLRLEGRGKVLNLTGSVEWSSFHEEGKTVPGAYMVGMKFNNVSKEKMAEIHGFIEGFRKEQTGTPDVSYLSGTRAYVRFQIHSPDKAVLYGQEKFRLINVSLSGMLVESEDLLQTGEKLVMEINRSKQKVIKCLGRIVTSQPFRRDDREYSRIGVEFVNMSEKDREMLKEIVCVAENMGLVAL